MKKLNLVVFLLILLITAGCEKVTQTQPEEETETEAQAQTDAEESSENKTYKAEIVETSEGKYEVQYKSVSAEELDYEKIDNSNNRRYLNEVLPPLLQKITDETGITFDAYIKLIAERWEYIYVDIHRNGNTMSNYELKQILPNLNSYDKSFVPGIDIKYIQRDSDGYKVSLDEWGYWDENGGFTR